MILLKDKVHTYNLVKNSIFTQMYVNKQTGKHKLGNKQIGMY